MEPTAQPAVPPPQGEVALVFTDVQGSTSLWERYPGPMRQALALHNSLLRELLARWQGYEVKTEGDAFMVAFDSPLRALRWCLSVQEALLDLDWPAELLSHPDAQPELDAGRPLARGLRVRMGLHWGRPEVCQPDPVTGRMDYFGPAVNRAARIAAAAHGGQILAGARAWAAVESSLGGLDAPVHADLGLHRLKGLESVERLFQVLPRTLARRSFPPPRTLDPRKTNLPANPDRFVGRSRDLLQLERSVQSSALVTVVGPGGIGKTRLATRFAAKHLDEFAEGGVWWCDLAAARDLEDLCRSLAAALSVPLSIGSAGAAGVEQLGHALAARGRTLVLFDNFEQLVPLAAETLGRWLALAPKACLLVTSRERLRLSAELVQEIEPMELPAAGGPAAGSESVQLLLLRGRAGRPQWQPTLADEEQLGEIARRLDGLPLALELAAARLRVMGPAQLLARLERRFEVLTGGSRERAARQATLRAAIDWSWDGLASWEQQALAQCSIFRGGFSLESAEAVIVLPAPGAPAVLDVVQSLCDKSLLRQQEPTRATGELRLGMLESIRDYAWERLVAGGTLEETAQRHEAHFLSLAEPWADQFERRGALELLRRLTLEQENLTAVFERLRARAMSSRSAAERAARALLALDPALATRGPFTCHLSWLEEVHSALVETEADGALAAAIRERRGRAHRARGHLAESAEDYQRVLDWARAAGESAAEGWALLVLGALEEARGRPGTALDGYRAALPLVRSGGNRRHEGVALNNLGDALRIAGRLDEGRRELEAALEVFREIGDTRAEGLTLANLGLADQEDGRASQARGRFGKSIELLGEVGDRRLLGIVLGDLSLLDHEAGALGAARTSLEQSLRHLGEVGDRRHEGIARARLAALQAQQDEVEAARASLSAARRILSEVGDEPRLAALEIYGALIDLAHGRPEQARQVLRRALEMPALERSDEQRLALRLLERAMAARGLT